MTALTLFSLPSDALHPDVYRLLDRLSSDEDNAAEVELICAGIVAVERDGLEDPNALRDWLRDDDHDVWLTKPHLVGSVVHRLAQAGLLKPAGWTVSTDRRGGNAGKPCRVWRLVGDPR